MKKIISIFIACIIITLVGCARDSNEHEGEAKTPSGSSVQKGRDYQEVVNVFEEKGFKNIKTEKMEDLITGWLTKDGEVKSVSVDGDKDYKPDVWYSNDVEVVITYHTFPQEEKPKTTKNPEVTEASGVSGDRNVSGFDTKTNKTITWGGVVFSFPSYFGVLDKGSTETWMTYYPEEEDYYASILFQSRDFSGTLEYFNRQIPSIVKSTLDEFNANTKILKSEKISIAGLPGWTITFSESDIKGDGVTSTGSYSFAYNINTGKVVMITCLYDSIDKSQYDYLGDYEKVLKTAKLLTKPLDTENPITEKSRYEKAYRVRFQEYDICYLIDEDAHTVSVFDTTEEYTYIYTSAYTGDFNNGIDFEVNGLKHHAHYKYWDVDTTLIVADESGNENKAEKRDVDTIEKQIKLRP
jgi:mRNA-degrading endonuclease RelE of RelBE toxin-antitoxin system